MVWEKGIWEDGRDCQGQAKGAPLGQGMERKCWRWGVGGTGVGKGKKPSPLLHSLHPHSLTAGAGVLGQRSLGSIKGSPVS